MSEKQTLREEIARLTAANRKLRNDVLEALMGLQYLINHETPEVLRNEVPNIIARITKDEPVFKSVVISRPVSTIKTERLELSEIVRRELSTYHHISVDEDNIQTDPDAPTGFSDE